MAMNRNMTLLAVIAVLVLGGLGVGYVLNGWPNAATTPDAITIGITPFESSTLVFVAEEQGLFVQNGLNVTIRNYPTALASIEGLLNNETEMAFAGEYVVVSKAFTHEDIRVLGSIDQYHSVYLVGRKDRGVETVSDLNGKTIGVSRGGPPEFYLGRFLYLHGMGLANVTLVNVPPSQYVDAITNGSVDAIVTPSKYLAQINGRLGADTLVLWPAQSSQPGYHVITSQDDWVASHPEQIKKVLTALAQAEEYTTSHPEEAKAILQTRMNYTDDQMVTVWSEHQFSLTLDKSLLTAMDDEARWMIANNLTSATTVPNYRDYVSLDGLLTVKPMAVTIR
jgi:ABC-type nitrate/sulfonate/bicarbonate transport system substrate-binding protein